MEPFVFDDEYVRRLRQGDAVIEEHFYAHVRKSLRNMLWRRVASTDAAEEIIQETFKRLFQQLHTIEDARKLGAFVWGIARNVLNEHYRRLHKIEQLDERLHDAPDQTDLDAAVDAARNATLVQRVLDDLGPPDADLLRAYYMSEESKDEICRRFGVTRDYLRVLVHRAKEKFRRMLVTIRRPPSLPE